jgi:hypothetical protein
MARLEDLQSFDDRELLARVLQAEAGNQGLTGKLAVGAVIRNRAQEGGYGDGLRGVLTKPGQFSPVNRYTGYASGEQGVDLGRINPDEDTYAVADAILTGQYEDPTGGATHFYNPDISTPGWGREAGGNWMTLGQHIFGRADAGRESYASEELLNGGSAGDILSGDPRVGAALSGGAGGPLTESEAQKYVSEDFLPSTDEDSFLDKLGKAAEGMDVAGLFDQPKRQRVKSLDMTYNRPQPNSGSRALQRMGIASLA